MKTSSNSRLVWFDTEYTTLELENASLLQVAMVVTDNQGCRIAPPEEDVVTAVKLTPDTPISDFVATECPALVQQARQENTPSVRAVDDLLAGRLDALLGPVSAKMKDRPVLAGNTIHADWWLARKFLPQFMNRLHYRQLDVSSLKILWLEAGLGPEFDKANTTLIQENLPGWTLPAGSTRHDALYDVMCSIAELNYYRRHFLRA